MVTERETYHHGNLRQALVDAALSLAARLGPEGVSVREAARLAGVSSGAPFRHFPNRRALMTAVAEEASGHLRIKVQRSVRASDRTAHRRLQAIGRAYLHWAEDHPAHFRIISARDQIDIDTSPGLQSGIQAVREQTEETIRAAQAEGSIDDAWDAGRLSLLSRACVYGLARMRIDGHLPQWGVAPGDESRALDDALALLLQLMRKQGQAGPA
ncbi:MAG: TetR/AcrR family transcriptional regulator [Pseudomonadota bacterium]